MKWIEIIELRSNGINRKQIESVLHEYAEQIEKNPEGRAVKVHTNVSAKTDFRIHLYHDSDLNNLGSTLGIRLVSTLKPLGLVSHTIWIEKLI